MPTVIEKLIELYSVNTSNFLLYFNKDEKIKMEKKEKKEMSMQILGSLRRTRAVCSGLDLGSKNKLCLIYYRQNPALESAS